jgi:hypothetical protein
LQCGNRVARIALCDDAARAFFAPTTLGGDTEFELHVVEAHSRTRMACDVSVRDSTANADNHGDEEALAG